MSKIATHSGKILDLAMPLQDAICIEDIAHHLSHINRFNGATSQPYSVAAHSVYCSWIVQGNRNTKLSALMHDAAEAYVGDTVTPMKEMIPQIRHFEQGIWLAICQKFDLAPVLNENVKKADVRALVTERLRLCARSPEIDALYEERFPFAQPHDHPLPVGHDSKDLFLYRYEELTI
jgi:hypothetical protein